MIALTRRRMLTVGVGGAALLGLGGGLAWLTAGYELGPGDVPIGLSAKELAVVRAIVAALLPADGDLPAAVALGVHQRIDEEVWAAPDPVRADLRAAIQLLEHMPPLHGFPGRFSSLAPAARLACFERYLRGSLQPLCQAAVALKQMCHLFYFARDETWGPIAYDGPWIRTPRPPDSALRYAALLAAGRTA